MKVTVANSFHVAGSLALPVGLGSHADESLVVGPFEWAHDMHARFGRLLAARAVGVDDTDESSAACAEAAGPGVDDADAAASLAAAQLEGIQLAAREIAHLVNNDLAVTVGTLDLLRSRGDVPAHVVELLDQALAGLSAVSNRVDQLQRVQRVVTRATPAGPSLDLDRSV